jgi:hypothetical protein
MKKIFGLACGAFAAASVCSIAAEGEESHGGGGDAAADTPESTDTVAEDEALEGQADEDAADSAGEEE